MDSIDVSSPLTEVIDASAHLGDGALSVPASGWLMGADFAREGYDLVVSGGEGQKFIVMDYFSTDEPLGLMTPENGTLRGDIVAQKAGPLNPGEYAQAAGTATAEPIGVVETLQGGVEAIRVDGTKVALEQGDPIFRGDLIETSSNGSVSMVMADDSVFSLDADGTVKMDELVYDPEDQEGSMSVSLVKGVFSFVSGQIAKTDPDAMVLNTPLATVGIRGTTGIMDLPEGGSVQIVLAPDDNGETGELTIQPLGLDGQPFGAPVTVNIPLAAVGVAPGGATQTFTIPAAQFQQQYGAIVSRAQQAQQSATNSGDDDDDDDDDGSEVQGDDGVDAKSATAAAADQDNSEGAEDEASEQDDSAGAEKEAKDQAGGEPEPEPDPIPPGPSPTPPGDDDDDDDDDDEEEIVEETGPENVINVSGAGQTASLTDGNDAVLGSSGFDSVNLMGAAQSGDRVDLMGDTDSLHLYPSNNVLSVANVETITASEGGGDDMVTATTNFSGGSVDLDSGDDTLNLADGGNTLSVNNVENVNGGAGTDTLSYTGNANFLGTNFSSIEAITFGTTAGGMMSINSATSFGGGSLTINGAEGFTNTLSSADGINFSNTNVTLSEVDVINFDSDNSGVSTFSFGALSAPDMPSINGGSDGNDIISVGGGTYGFTGITITNVATLQSTGGGADDITLGTVPSGLAIDLGGGTDILKLSAGNDTIMSTNVETVNGNAGNDEITSTAGALTLDGGAGNDTLIGDSGSNVLIGGAGADIFRFNNSNTVDKVNDFSRADGDKLSLDIDQLFTANVISGGNLRMIHDFADDFTGEEVMLAPGQNLNMFTNALPKYANEAAFLNRLNMSIGSYFAGSYIAFGFISGSEKLVAAKVNNAKLAADSVAVDLTISLVGINNVVTTGNTGAGGIAALDVVVF